MKKVMLFEEFINENTLTKGVFAGYDEIKNKVVIPLEDIDISKYELDNYKMPKTTVGIGFELNKSFKFQYGFFDMYILNGKLCVLVNKKGKFHLNVNIKNGNYTLEDFIENIKNASLVYLERLMN